MTERPRGMYAAEARKRRAAEQANLDKSA
jgi:hypothetical protein